MQWLGQRGGVSLAATAFRRFFRLLGWGREHTHMTNPIDPTILTTTVPVDAPARGGGGVGGRAPGKAVPGVRPLLHSALQARFVFVLFCFVLFYCL